MQAFPPFSLESSQSGENSCIIAGIYDFRAEVGEIPAFLQEFSITDGAY